MTSLVRGVRWITAILLYAVGAPVALFLLLLYLGAAVVIGLLLSLVFVMVLAGFVGSVSNPVQWLVAIPTVAACLIVGGWMWSEKLGVRSLFRRGAGDTHGSARLGNAKEIAALARVGDAGLLIGRDPKTGKLLGYDGPAHLLTLAPTRAGKGVGTVVPNLLMGYRSMLVIDPKGENVRVAGQMRADYGPTHVLDPFGVSGMGNASYNPLERMTPDSLDLGEDASTLAAALVMDPPGQAGEAHWNEEARALIAGLILFCVVHEDAERKTLGTVREYLTLPPERFRELLGLMQESPGANGLVARAANRFLGKADREAAGVLSGAQRHTHFLDSPRIAQSLASSDFRFADLRRALTTVFLVLPPNRMDAYSRWLRLLVSEALQDIARDAEAANAPYSAQEAAGAPESPEEPPEAPSPSPALSAPLAGPGGRSRLQTPTLFLLDEFAALGRLEAVERAMGLMAGYGLQLWPILQDLSQLRDLYGTRANTFVANAGVLQVFGVNDVETARWLSQALGKQTIGYETRTHRPGDMPSTAEHVTGRELLTPDEIMQLPQSLQLLRLQGRPPVLAQKLRYYADPEFKDLFLPEVAR
jgi:type IV secretion system protein VirD4